MVRKARRRSAAPSACAKLATAHPQETRRSRRHRRSSAFDTAPSGSPHLWDDYQVGEKIDHVDGITVEEAEHMLATRLYQNTARVHFNQFAECKGRFGRSLIYGGHVIGLPARFRSMVSLMPSILGHQRRPMSTRCSPATRFLRGRKCSTTDRVTDRKDVGALRLRTIATRDRPCADFPFKSGEDYDPAILLDLDYWVLMPR